MVDGRPRGIEVPLKDTPPGTMVAFCEFFSDTRQANLHVRNATIAPGRVSFNGTSMPLGRPSTISDRPP